MAFYNTEESADSASSIANSKEVGENCRLELPGDGEGESTPVADVSLSEEAETSEVQYTDSFTTDLAVTGVTYSGSFTIPGNANTKRNQLWSQGTGEKATLPNYISTMVIQDTTHRYEFTGVMVNSHSKDITADDRSEHSFDFQAESLTVNTIGEN